MKPKYTLHKLPQGFIATSDEQIKEGDSFYRNTGVISVMNKELSRYYESIKDLSAHNEYKLIAQQNQIDFSSLSEEEQKEIGLNQYDFAQMFYEILKKTYPCFDEWIEAKEYKKAQELLSDRIDKSLLNDALMIGYLYAVKNTDKNGTKLLEDEVKEKLIQSLSQKSWKVEVEMEKETLYTDDGLDYKGNLIPKLTNGKIKILYIL
jgi:alpha-galactosidase/6-phospho-beta-glucosidase family protein